MCIVPLKVVCMSLLPLGCSLHAQVYLERRGGDMKQSIQWTTCGKVFPPVSDGLQGGPVAVSLSSPAAPPSQTTLTASVAASGMYHV